MSRPPSVPDVLGREVTPRPFPNWLRQRSEAIIWTLKKQLGLEHHNARVRAGFWTRSATPTRPRHRYLAQLEHRRTRQTAIDRLRPLTRPPAPISGQRSRPDPMPKSADLDAAIEIIIVDGYGETSGTRPSSPSSPLLPARTLGLEGGDVEKALLNAVRVAGGRVIGGAGRLQRGLDGGGGGGGMGGLVQGRAAGHVR
jgi:hypothetical protein